jgi:hypothetical protein
MQQELFDYVPRVVLRPAGRIFVMGCGFGWVASTEIEASRGFVRFAEWYFGGVL